RATSLASLFIHETASAEFSHQNMYLVAKSRIGTLATARAMLNSAQLSGATETEPMPAPTTVMSNSPPLTFEREYSASTAIGILLSSEVLTVPPLRSPARIRATPAGLSSPGCTTP